MRRVSSDLVEVVAVVAVVLNAGVARLHLI